MKVWCLIVLFVRIRQMNKANLMGYRKKFFKIFLSLQLNEFLESEIRQKLSSVQKIACINAITDKKIITLLDVSGMLCSPSAL